MTKQFWLSVYRDGTKDTRKYRYNFDSNSGVIYRIKLEYLDTVASLDPANWVPCHILRLEDFT